MSHLITIMACSQLHVLANENAELAGRSQQEHHVALLSELLHVTLSPRDLLPEYGILNRTAACARTRFGTCL